MLSKSLNNMKKKGVLVELYFPEGMKNRKSHTKFVLDVEICY